jgi:hypothetical protein
VLSTDNGSSREITMSAEFLIVCGMANALHGFSEREQAHLGLRFRL